MFIIQTASLLKRIMHQDRSSDENNVVSASCNNLDLSQPKSKDNVTPRIQSSASPRNNLCVVEDVSHIRMEHNYDDNHTWNMDWGCLRSFLSSIPCESFACVKTFQDSTPVIHFPCIQYRKPSKDIRLLKSRKQNRSSVTFPSSGPVSLITVLNLQKRHDEEWTTAISALKTIQSDDVPFVLQTQSEVKCKVYSNGSLIELKSVNEKEKSYFHLNFPFQFTQDLVMYYEVTILEMNTNNPQQLDTLCIGIGPYDSDLRNHVGWYCESVAYHSDDGRIRNNQLQSMYRVVGGYSKGDTIGVMWNLNNGLLCFTQNGKFIDYKTTCNLRNIKQFMASITGEISHLIKIRINTGSEPFACRQFNQLYALSSIQVNCFKQMTQTHNKGAQEHYCDLIVFCTE